MPVQIKIDQAAHAPGTPGFSREDLATGTGVTLTATGGPFLHYLWSILDKPVDIIGGSQSAAILAAPTSAVTGISPIDISGTYLVQVVVDSGSGLGANPGDVAQQDFYAGPTLSVDPTELPRREMAFLETTTHNVPDAVFPGGNPRGWAQERQRWQAVLQEIYKGKSRAWARVALPGGGPATLVDSYNVAGVLRTGVGLVTVTFAKPLPANTYAVIGSPRGVGGACFSTTELVGSFVANRQNAAGAAVDADFTFGVKFL